MVHRRLPNMNTRFRALIREAVGKPLGSYGFADVTRALRPCCPPTDAFILERRLGVVWHRVCVVRYKYNTKGTLEFNIDFAVGIVGFAALVWPGEVDYSQEPVLRGRAGLRVSGRDVWWRMWEPGLLTLRPRRAAEKADAALAAGIAARLATRLMPLLESLSTIDQLRVRLLNPEDLLRDDCIVTPYAAAWCAGVVAALSGRRDDAVKSFAAARALGDQSDERKLWLEALENRALASIESAPGGVAGGGGDPDAATGGASPQ